MSYSVAKFGLKMSLTYGIFMFFATIFLSTICFLLKYHKTFYVFKLGLLVSLIGFILIFFVSVIGPFFFNIVWDFLGKYLGED